ncbi:MAG: methyltransferase domain-containing protein [Polyangiaceae bacterium]|nr:methyltransferase domain-containing protein [Polyangiaceae bacterium]
MFWCGAVRLRGEARAQLRGITAGSLKSANFEANGFDAVVLHHVIEHMLDPISALRELLRILEPGAGWSWGLLTLMALARDVSGRTIGCCMTRLMSACSLVSPCTAVCGITDS